MNFVSDSELNYHCDTTVYWFLFYENQVLMETRDNKFQLPLINKALLNLNITPELYMGTLDGKPCYAAQLTEIKNISSNMNLFMVRDLYGKMTEDLFWLVGRAFHLSTWDRHTLYCGSCGSPTEKRDMPIAKICPQCRQLIFPRISPAIIVAIVKDKQILLARNRNLPADLYTVIAGFVEPGETLEECVCREVREEVGITVKNICYFSSQPWPFPDSLMIAFTSEYAAGDIKVDGDEIIEAGWFAAANLPQIPGSISVARKLINWFGDNFS
jgi:NAD+ diphosphatase